MCLLVCLKLVRIGLVSIKASHVVLAYTVHAGYCIVLNDERHWFRLTPDPYFVLHIDWTIQGHFTSFSFINWPGHLDAPSGLLF